MANDWKDREQVLSDVLKIEGFANNEILAMRQKLANSLQMLADKNTSVDTGMDAEGDMDFLVTISGKEYLVMVGLSNSERKKIGKPYRYINWGYKDSKDTK